MSAARARLLAAALLAVLVFALTYETARGTDQQELALVRVASGEMASDVARSLGVAPGVVQRIAREKGLGGRRLSRNQFGTWPVRSRRC